MIWYDDPYYGCPHIRRRYKKIKRKIIRKKAHEPVFILAVSLRSNNLMESIPSRELLQEAYPTEDLAVIGMACDRAQSKLLAKRIIEEVYAARGDLDIKSYLGLCPKG